jgi:uncharacterized protein (TIGR03435 family)
MSAHAVQAAPAALAKSVTATALTPGAATAGSTPTLIKGALKIMTWTKAKTAVVVGVAALLATGTTTLTLREIQEHRWYSWEVPKADFALFYQTPPQVKIVPTKFQASGGSCCDGTRGAMGIAQPVQAIIQTAFRSDSLRTVFPPGLPTNRFDFFAKLVPPRKAHEKMAVNKNWTLELQKLIAKQFGLQGRLEPRATDVLALKPVGDGVRGFAVSHQMPGGIAFRSSPGHYAGIEQPVSTLTQRLEALFKIPIVDQTGLTGNYDFTLQWDEPDRQQPNLDGLQQALRDQLGLELAPTNLPLEMLVVEKMK